MVSLFRGLYCDISLICYVWPTQNQKALKKTNLKFEELAREEFVYTGQIVYGESVDDESVSSQDDIEAVVDIKMNGEKGEK
jgi:hypothetical protein